MAAPVQKEVKRDSTFSWIKFALNKHLVVAIAAAVMSVMASALMNLTEAEIFRVILRQFVQVIGIKIK